jgi:GNAT superfamily N-acetyltransferase
LTWRHLPGLLKRPFPDFATLNALFDTVSWFHAEGQILALDGERYVGLAALGYFTHTNAMYNMMTGVDKTYRGRKIAQALKLLALQYVQSSGAAYIRTHNNSLNAPMLAINRNDRSQSVAAVGLLVTGNTEFALALCQKLRAQPGNLFFSLHSIATALAMTYAGARGTTALEMAQAHLWIQPVEVGGNAAHHCMDRTD